MGSFLLVLHFHSFKFVGSFMLFLLEETANIVWYTVSELCFLCSPYNNLVVWDKEGLDT